MRKKLLLLSLLAFIFCSKTFAYDLTVAQDGSGTHTTVQAAINAAPTGLSAPYTIFIKNGKYKEKITVPSNKPFIQLIGESVANVFIYYDDCASTAGGTSASASFTINASDFSAFNITFANTFDFDAGVIAGVSGLQAVAVLVNGDRVAFKNCRFQGNQDTLYQNKKGYYKNCYIDGIIDFIFGGGASIFDSCTVYPKTRTTGGSSYITAANTPAGQTYGYVFRDCKVISNPGGTNYVLGRPWQNSTGQTTAENKVVFLNSILNANVSAAGWAVWDAGTITSQITYAEYASKFFNGNPVDVSGRISWSQQLNAGQAATYTNANVFAAGGAWDPCTVYPGICDPAATDIAVSNFLAVKGVGTANFKWNLSWGIDQVKFELFRSLVRNGSYTKIGEVTSPNDTTYNYSYLDNALPPGQQVYYYLLASKAGFASHITDTLLVSSKPTINVVGSLGAFLQGGYVPSSSQNYTVNGVNLSDNIVITTPANFEISLNNATWITSAGNITLPPTSGIVNNTTIYVRLNAATAPGSFSGNIVHATTNGDTVLLPVSGTSQVAALTPPAYFRSKATGPLSDVNTWETSADSVSWVAASFVPTGAAEENITIMPSNTVTVDVAHTVNGKWTLYGSGANTGGIILIGGSPGALTFANNSSLVWNRDGGTLPTGTVFSAGSTFLITGSGNGVAFGSGSLLPTINAAQVFHHVVINAPNCKTNNPSFGGTLNTINGNLTVISTGGYGYKMRLLNGPTQVVNIGGDLIVNPTIGSHVTFVLYSTSTIATTQAVNVAGNIYVGNNYVTNITGTNGTFASGSTAVTLSAANPNIVVGMGVTGTNIAANSWVTAVSGTSLTLSTNTSGTGSNTALTFVQATGNLTLSDAGAALAGNTGTFTSGSNTITGLAGATIASIQPGMTIAATGIPANTQVLTVVGTTLTLSANTTAAGTNAALSFTSTVSKTNLKGNLTLNNGTIAVNGSGLGAINISRTDGVPQFYSRLGTSTVPGAMTCNVLANAIFDVGTSALNCITNINANATLRSGSATGVPGNLTGTRTLSSAANYVFNGTIAQSANNNFTTATPTVLTVNSITVNNTAGVTLGNSLTVNNLNLSTGKLTLGAANINANTVTGGSSTAYVVTDAAGKLKIKNVGATDVTFPVGPSTTSYNPVIINNAGTVDSFAVSVATAPPAGINTLPQSDSAVNRTWTINEDVAGGSNATVTLQWDAAHQNSLFATNNCAVVHSNGTVIDYSGAYSAANGSGPYTQTGTGFTSFSPFGVGSKPAAVLPLSLLSFNAQFDNRNVKLVWQTENEINTRSFDIERSADGNNFSVLGNVAARNTAGRNNYTITDINPFSGVSFYRLKMIDRDGRYRYSAVIAVNNKKQLELKIFPNPVGNNLFVTHAKVLPGAKFEIYAMDGRKMNSYDANRDAVQTNIDTRSLPLGNYNLVFVNGTEVQFIKFSRQ